MASADHALDTSGLLKTLRIIGRSQATRSETNSETPRTSGRNCLLLTLQTRLLGVFTDREAPRAVGPEVANEVFLKELELALAHPGQLLLRLPAFPEDEGGVIVGDFQGVLYVYMLSGAVTRQTCVR